MKNKTSKELDLSISNIWVRVQDKNTFNRWYIYFKCEFDRDKYIRRSHYFKNIRIIDYDDIYKFNYTESERW